MCKNWIWAWRAWRDLTSEEILIGEFEAKELEIRPGINAFFGDQFRFHVVLPKKTVPGPLFRGTAILSLL